MQTSTVSGIPSDLRTIMREGGLAVPTAGMAPGYVQTNLAVLPRDMAFDFLLFCQRNPKPCPLLEVIEDGCTEPQIMAPGADLRTDLPKYRVFQNGEMIAEVDDVSQFWRDDLVSFLLGCSFTFELSLIRADVPVRHIEAGTNVPMFITNIDTIPSGVFSGPMVVSMRPIPEDKVVRAIQVTSRFPAVHGAPIHVGDPEAIGISDVNNPDLGDAVEINEGEVPVFWACGVTPQAVAMNSKPPLFIAHSPGYMFLTDAKDEDFALI